MSHTPEPWIVNGSIRIESEHEHGFVNDGWIIGDLDGPDAKENARRIVACVNACEGLTQDHFDGGWKAKEIIAYAANLESERDTYRDLCADLLNALKMTYEYHAPGYHDCTDNGLPECEWCESKKAITKAEKILNPEQPK